MGHARSLALVCGIEPPWAHGRDDAELKSRQAIQTSGDQEHSRQPRHPGCALRARTTRRPGELLRGPTGATVSSSEKSIGTETSYLKRNRSGCKCGRGPGRWTGIQKRARKALTGRRIGRQAEAPAHGSWGGPAGFRPGHLTKRDLKPSAVGFRVAPSPPARCIGEMGSHNLAPVLLCGRTPCPVEGYALKNIPPRRGVRFVKRVKWGAILFLYNQLRRFRLTPSPVN